VSVDISREERERKLVFARIKELAENPIRGRFDTAHLKAMHAYLFQDLPEHQPGVIRGDTDGWHKARELEGRGPSHVVHYMHTGVEARIDTILQDFGGPATLRGVPRQAAAVRLAKLYGDLDHAHGFCEGNSRTLREFMRELALAAGHTLRWIRSDIGPDARNALYVARDVAVLERSYPGLTEERAMATADRAEYVAWWHLKKLRELQGENSLEHIVGEALTQREMGRAGDSGKVKDKQLRHRLE
jgi:fido (protein-threonine AMPylation protein)